MAPGLPTLEFSSRKFVKFENQKDGSIFVGGRSAKGSYIINSTTNKDLLTGIRIEAMEDNRLPRKGPGRAPNDGNFVLSELEVLASPPRTFRIGRK